MTQRHPVTDTADNDEHDAGTSQPNDVLDVQRGRSSKRPQTGPSLLLVPHGPEEPGPTEEEKREGENELFSDARIAGASLFDALPFAPRQRLASGALLGAETEAKQDVGDIIRYLRIQACLTQKELAVLLGLSRVFVNRLEVNGALPSQKTLDLLAQALKLSSIDLAELQRRVRSARRLNTRHRFMQTPVGQHRLDTDETHQLFVSESIVCGRYGTALTPQTAMQFAQRFALALKQQNDAGTPGAWRVLLARDCQPSSIAIHHAVLSALMGYGCTVVNLGAVPTPTLQLSIPSWNASGGISIVASDRALNWSGLKFFGGDGAYFPLQGGESSGDMASAPLEWNELGSMETDDEQKAVQQHIDRILNLVKVKSIRDKKLVVVLDDSCDNYPIAERLLEALGSKVLLVSQRPGPSNASPRQEEEEGFYAFERYTELANAHIGFSLDADADRLRVATEDGRLVDGQRLLCWAINHTLRHRIRGPVVTDWATTMTIETIARLRKCEVIRTPPGGKSLTSKMRKVRAAIGGDGEGGLILPVLHDARDGLMAMALVLESLALTGKPASLLSANQKVSPFLRQSHVSFPRSKFDHLLENLRAWRNEGRANRQEAQIQEWPHGIKVEWAPPGSQTHRARSWAMVWLSDIEPCVHIVCESYSHEETECLQKEIRKRVESVAAQVLSK